MLSTWFQSAHPVTQAFLAAAFTWLLTAAGAALVFLFSGINRKVMNAMLGFAAGVMIAVSFWGLLGPAVEMAREAGQVPWLPAAIGFVAGMVFLLAVDRILPHLHLEMPRERAEGLPTAWRRSVLLVLAITLHNIPEGLAVGIAFGALGTGFSGASLSGAVVLAIGIGLQNFPEGAAVSIPLRRDGLSPLKSFWYGQLSGAVEPVAAVIGAATVMLVTPLLPYALAFAAGAMLYVVIEELIPESQLDRDTDLGTVGALLGFVVMMILDISLG